MGMPGRSDQGDQNFYRIRWLELHGKHSFGRLREWVNNTQIGSKEIWHENVNQIHLAQDRDQ
jgi:hypothetical protein